MPRPIVSWFRGWKPFVGRALHHSALQFSSCLSIYSLVVLVFAALLYIFLRSPELRENIWDWLEETSVMLFVIVVIFFALYLVLVFILSLHPRTRRLASKLSIFLNEPELEKLKERVGTVETELALVKKRLDGLDTKADMTNRALGDMQRNIGNIEERSANIQDTLRTITKTDSKEGRDG
jgi:hypothetical protein